MFSELQKKDQEKGSFREASRLNAKQGVNKNSYQKTDKKNALQNEKTKLSTAEKIVKRRDEKSSEWQEAWRVRKRRNNQQAILDETNAVGNKTGLKRLHRLRGEIYGTKI